VIILEVEFTDTYTPAKLEELEKSYNSIKTEVDNLKTETTALKEEISTTNNSISEFKDSMYSNFFWITLIISIVIGCVMYKLGKLRNKE